MTGRTTLKSWFVTGAKPPQSQFAELINSMFNLVDDALYITDINGLLTQLDGIQAALSGLAAGTVPAPVISATMVEFSKADLNGAYPAAVNGQYVLCAAINTKYLKLDNSPTGNWDMQPYNPVV